MSKKILIIIAAIILGVVILIGGTFIYLNSKTTDSQSITLVETLKRLNPFGESDPLGVRDILGIDSTNNIASSTTNTESGIVSNQLLFRLSNERSSGIGFADVLVPKVVEIRKSISIDNPLVASSSKAKKIKVMATTTETVYATTSRVRYVEQGSGHIYEYDYASSSTRKLTNTTIPKTQEAYFLDNGNKVLLRYLDTTNRLVENYLASIPTSSVADKLTGEFLSNNITSIATSPSGSEFFYIAKTQSGSIGNIYNIKSGVEKRVFSSAFSEWLPEWSTTGILLTTKAHSTVQGFSYLQSLTKNTFTRISGNKLGLTTLPNPDSTRILLGEGISLSIFNPSTANVVPISSIKTLPEKCVWLDTSGLLCFGTSESTEGAYPENWYQGKVSFSDNLYSVSVADGNAYLLATASELFLSDIEIDAIKIILSKDKRSLVFINKLDMTPWYLNLEKTFTSYQAQP